MPDNSPVYICMALAGFSVVLLLLGLLGLGRALPADDRRFRVPPPRLFVLLWPLIRINAWWVRRLIPMAWRTATHGRLRAAALDRALDVEHFVASRFLAAVLMPGILPFFLPFDGQAPVVPVLGVLLFALVGWFLPEFWLARRIAFRHRQILRELPFVLDIVTLCVEAGLSLNMAVAQAQEKCPPGPLTEELGLFLSDLRAGRPRTDALQRLADRIQLAAVNKLASAIQHAESMGASLGRALRVQADQRRNERFQLAEKMALEAPVKMLLPLILFIFPNTFIVIAFPVAMKFLHEGL